MDGGNETRATSSGHASGTNEGIEQGRRSDDSHSSSPSASGSGSPSGSGSGSHGQHRRQHSQTFPPKSPTTPIPSPDVPLLNNGFDSPFPSPRAPHRSFSSGGFISSPLNPHSPSAAAAASSSSSQAPYVRSRPVSRAASMNFARIASEDSQVLGAMTAPGQRGSMLLYRLAGEDDLLTPPHFPGNNRDSYASSSGESVFSLSADSKYPSGLQSNPRGLVPYAYDPLTDDAAEDDDLPKETHQVGLWSKRGMFNMGLLLVLIVAVLCLFIFYPVHDYYTRKAYYAAIDENAHINATGQAADNADLFTMPSLIDAETPESAKTRTGFDGEKYTLVFSDEFNTPGRTFYPGDDPFWEAVDLWYGSTNDMEWYDPAQVETVERDGGGFLRILMENAASHDLNYRSGMLQSWNKFCFTGGYIEVSITLPGDPSSSGYWPGAWTMGNLGRPGYRASTEGTWPYSYDTCDLGTFPNQTLKDGSGPASALHSDASKEKYNYELSWLPGQRVSACTCPNEDHPGPSNSKGRGAPEIDILEVERNKTTGSGQVVSQSAQFAPFTHDYLFVNDTTNEWEIFDGQITMPNSYKGSPIQQAVSALTMLPDDMFQNSGQVFTTLGFEYWADPDNRDDGFITWQSNGSPTTRMSAAAVGPDSGDDGSQVGQRIIPEEPMTIVLNLGMSTNWQTVDTTTMTFPAEMLVDYVRVYQREGHTNVGCSPDDYPTAKYIADHPLAYSNANLTRWEAQPDGTGAGYTWPKNSQWDGC